MPGTVALWSLVYQTVWVVSLTFLIWFMLVVKYSASRLSAFTFLTPLFGVFAGHVVLGDPITPAFAGGRGPGDRRPDPCKPAAVGLPSAAPALYLQVPIWGRMSYSRFHLEMLD